MSRVNADPSPGAAPECSGESPKVGGEVQTACGGVVAFTDETPCASWQGKTIYFCLPCCREDFLTNPHNSCLAHLR